MLQNICIIDDNPIFLLTATKMIQLQNCAKSICSFKNGEIALGHLKNEYKAGADLPDLILLDINMPVMDGWQFLDALRSLNFPNLTIYLLTSSVDPADITRAKTYKMLSGYLTKPLTPEVIDSLMIEIS
ncbi:response regulator [Neptunitalea chrysea]|uniref:Response regulator n=1 Tax=Neptunitalea chrysea TaxID=1647581 RepID=A0A9W6B6D4_9FLAO|nr:response regulator [Neptunitalea chrysea]GLB53463.1 response regulator [Neptunitalea chrysea]